MDDHDGKITRLRKKLYSRKTNITSRTRRSLRPGQYDVASRWQHESAKTGRRNPRRRKSKISIVFIASIIFFLGALGLASFFIFGGSNVISSKNIKIEIDGPTSIEGGEELSLQIAVTNENNVPIQLADLLIEYPEGTHSATNINKELPRSRQSLGDIKPGERVKRTVRSVLFGEENSTQNITVTVEYRVEGSNAIFFTERKYEVVLSSSPLTLVVEGLNETVSGQEVSLSLEVISNARAVLENVLVRAEYPFGFTFIEGSPEPAFSTNVFSLGDIPPEGKRKITIRGTLEGQDGETRVFRFAGGIASEDDENKLAASFITASHEFSVQRPFLSAALALNGDKSDSIFIARTGEQIRADLTITNNLPDSVFDGEISLTLSGAALDRSSVAVKQGFYRSVDNTVLWSKETNGDLATIESGGQRALSFTFTPVGTAAASLLRNPEIALSISVKGKRIGEQNVPETVESTLTREVVIASDLRLLSKALYFIGPFENSGPLPPKVEQQTTYTIVWTVTNTSNKVSDVVVSATLPSFVTWLSNVVPQGEEITFNPVGGKVTWRVGTLNAAVGTTLPAREVTFQVALLPSLSHKGQEPVLISEQVVRGTDQFTISSVESRRAPLTTSLSNDPQFIPDQSRVIP